ncbi:hypothetical protein PVAND_014220 [Polypedilum vanderplanki]|uniref:Gustatory receptor n=1 Tax=Polypedilum vanderplanki TaxID=319348 RepID=A0A9J6CS34_POLVA|nr:hypothetical protein PVAND_014220 [Polypedilum vanderplanki]
MAENIFDVMHFCSKFSKILNFNFVTFEKFQKNKYRARTTFCDVLRLIIGILLSSIMLIIVSERALELSSRSIIFEISTFMFTRIVVLNVIFVMLQIFFYRHEYFNILNNIQKIDKKLMLIGVTRNYNKDRLTCNKYLTIVEILIVIDMTFGYIIVRILNVRYNTMPLDDPFFLITMGIPMSYNVLFLIIVYNLHDRLKLIAENFEISKFKNLHKCFIRNKIELTMIMLDKISDTIMSINKFYTFNTMIILLKFTIINTMSTFLAYDVFVHNLGLDDIILAIGGYSYSLILGISCILIFFYTCFISKLFDKSFIQILDLKMKIRDEKICKQTFLALLQAQNYQKEISCGLFVLCWPQLFAMIVTIFNYIVVMVQFDKMILNNKF